MQVQKLYFRGQGFFIASVDTAPSHASWFSFIDESDVRERLWHIEPGDIVFDIGACYGSYALTALASGAKRVFAWSPPGPPAVGDEPEHKILRKSLELNRWESRCAVYDYGLYDQSGWLDTEWYGDGTQLRLLPANTGSRFVIEVSTLDRWYDSQVHILPLRGTTTFWMKIDVEGAEEAVIRGGLKTINYLRPRLLIENHPWRRPSIEEDTRQLVLSLGYREVETTPYPLNKVTHSFYVHGEDHA